MGTLIASCARAPQFRPRRRPPRRRRRRRVAAIAAMATSPPHFIWIVADDLGTFDVPFTNSGSEVRTPTLSRLAANGLVLDSYYVQPLCTPSRAAFMTGRHPVSLGLQHGVILDAVPDAVPINETLLPQLLRAAGYKSYFFGKWRSEERR